MTETDDPRDLGQTLAGQNISVPDLERPQNRQAAEEEFTITEDPPEADEPQRQTRDDDTRLSEDEEGERTLLEQRRDIDSRKAEERRNLSPEQKAEMRRNDRQRQRQARDRNIQENAFLRQKVDELEARQAALEPRVANIDQGRLRDQSANVTTAISNAEAAAAAATRRMTEAFAAGDGEAAAAAIEERDRARDLRAMLLPQKDQLDRALATQPTQQAPQQRQAAPQPPPLPRIVQEFVSDFSAQHAWYSNPTDRRAQFDAETVKRLDNEVAAEGFNPATQDYWEELNDRVREYLPHSFEEQRRAPAARTQAAPAANTQRRGPMTGGSSERGPAPSKNSVYVSPERKQALIAAGAMGADGSVADRPRLNRLLKSYHDYDRQQSGARQ